MKLATTTYVGTNHTRLTELLRDRWGVNLSRRTVHRILTRAGISSPRQRRPPDTGCIGFGCPRKTCCYRSTAATIPGWRSRAPGSPCCWRWTTPPAPKPTPSSGPKRTPGATSCCWKGSSAATGFPLAIYGDRHGVFKFAGKPRHIPQPVGPTHFSRAMPELGIEQVFARSPQAKGRVERMAGALRDRLVSELRLTGATTIDEASAVLQEFLPGFNQQFLVPAQQPKVAISPPGPLPCPGTGSLLQAHPPGGPAQHRQVPV